MSAEQQTEGTRVYDRLVGVDAEGRLPPVVSAQLKGDPGTPGKPGSPGSAGVSVESVERTGDDTEAKAVFRLSDESTHEVALPRGPQGAKGAKGDPGATVNIRDNGDGTVTIEGGASA